MLVLKEKATNFSGLKRTLNFDIKYLLKSSPSINECDIYRVEKRRENIPGGAK